VFDDLPILGEVGDALKGAFRRREAHDVGRAMRRRRFLILAPIGALVATGGAIAAVAALSGRPSAPLTGPVAPTAIDSAPGSGITHYSVNVIPDLSAGSIGWCINEQVQIPAPIPVNDVVGLRRALIAVRRAVRQRRALLIAQAAGKAVTVTGPNGYVIALPAPSASQLSSDRAELPTLMRITARQRTTATALLRELDSARERRSASFQQAARSLLVGHQYTEPGSSCGHVQRGHEPFVGGPYIGFIGSPTSAPWGPLDATAPQRLTTISVYLTTANVAGVRLGSGAPLLTRSSPLLPGGYRIAITATAGRQRLRPGQKPLNDLRIYAAGAPIDRFFGTVPSIAGWPAPVALDSRGRAIGGAPTGGAVSDVAESWRPIFPTSGVHPPVRVVVPKAACELRTRGIDGANPTGGAVVETIHGFPQLADDAFLSCASAGFGVGSGAASDNIVEAAILVDARDPGSRAPALPNSKPVPGHPSYVEEAVTQLVRSMTITARRVGPAWVVVETQDPVALRQRLRILDALAPCIHLTGARCAGIDKTEPILNGP
jgi:hypothetical protein